MGTKGHFPKKGERLVDGVWVMPRQGRATTPPPASERLAHLRKLAGWPPLKEKNND